MYDISNKANAIRELQRYLLELSQSIPELPSHPVDGVYSDATQNDVLLFQSHAGLPETGNVDFATWCAIVKEYKTSILQKNASKLPFPMTLPLSVGSRGSSVTLLQSVIYDLCDVYNNVPAPNVTGEYGTSPAYAVGILQRRYGLPETGTLDPLTWGRILADYSSSVRLSETLNA